MTTNNKIVISRIQHRRGLAENLPQPLRPGELALTTDVGELWIGGDPEQPPYGVRTYGASGTDANTAVYTKIAFATFAAALNEAEFNTLSLYLRGTPTPAVVLEDLDILWDGASTVFIAADYTVDATNTIANVLLAVQNSGVGTYGSGSALANLSFGDTPIETILSQTEADFDGVGSNGTFVAGGGGGATPYAPGDTITMIDGTVVTVGTVSTGGVATFSITAVSTSHGITTALTQQSTSGSGLGFTLTLGTNNYVEYVTSVFTVTGDGYYEFTSGFTNSAQAANAARLIDRVHGSRLVVILSNIQIPTSGAAVGSSTFRDMSVTDVDAGFTWSGNGTASADNTADELTFVSGTGINIDVDPTNDAIRITSVTGGNSFLGLVDTNLTGQATGDLVFNSDGTTWTDTAGLLTWDGVNTLTVVDTITSGAATAGDLLVAAGPLLAGASVSNGGDLNLEGGYSTTGFGGYVNITAGTSSAGTNLGGDVNILAGASSGNDGGGVFINGGAGSQFDYGGIVQITAGSPAGSVLYDNATGGDIILLGGDGGDYGGYAVLSSGNGILIGGDVDISGGNVTDKVNGDDGGNVNIYGGNGGANGTRLFNGRVKIQGGTGTDWPASGVEIHGGHVAPSAVTSVDGPPVIITGGRGQGAAEDGTIGGWVEIAGGECVGDIGGDLLLMAGVGVLRPGTVRIRPASEQGQVWPHSQIPDSGLNIAVFGDTTTSTSTIYDVAGTAPILEFFGNGTGSGDYLRLTAGNPGVADPILEAVGSGTNIGINLRTKGTGVVSVAGTTTYEANVTDDDDVPNKKYVDDAITTAISTPSPTNYTLTASTAAFTNVTGFNFDIDATADVIFVDYSLNIGGAVAGSNNYTAIGTLKIIANTLVNAGEATLVDDQTELRDTGLTGAVAFQATFVAGSPNRVQVQFTNTFTTNATLRVSTKQWMSY